MKSYEEKLFEKVSGVTMGDNEEEQMRNEHKLARILAVDDSPLILRSFKYMLEDQFEIRLAFSAEKGLLMIHDFEPDIIFLDYEMPQVNGIELFRQLKKNDRTKTVPVVFLTGMAERGKIIKALSERPAAYILKPLDKKKLISTIEKVLNIKVPEDEEA